MNGSRMSAATKPHYKKTGPHPLCYSEWPRSTLDASIGPITMRDRRLLKDNSKAIRIWLMLLFMVFVVLSIGRTFQRLERLSALERKAEHTI